LESIGSLWPIGLINHWYYYLLGCNYKMKERGDLIINIYDFG